MSVHCKGCKCIIEVEGAGNYKMRCPNCNIKLAVPNIECMGITRGNDEDS